MKSESVEIKTKREGGEVAEWAGEIELPETCAEAAEQYGQEVVDTLLAAQIKTNKMNIARAALRDGKDVAAAVAAYVPGQKRERTPTDPTQAILANFGKMDPEAKKAMIKQLRDALAA